MDSQGNDKVKIPPYIALIRELAGPLTRELKISRDRHKIVAEIKN